MMFILYCGINVFEIRYLLVEIKFEWEKKGKIKGWIGVFFRF